MEPVGGELGEEREEKAEEEEYKNVSEVGEGKTVNAGILAIFTRVTKQSFDSALELMLKVLSFQRPLLLQRGGWTAGCCSTLSVQDGALECGGECSVGGFESICHVKPCVG